MFKDIYTNGNEYTYENGEIFKINNIKKTY